MAQTPQYFQSTNIGSLCFVFKQDLYNQKVKEIRNIAKSGNYWGPSTFSKYHPKWPVFAKLQRTIKIQQMNIATKCNSMKCLKSYEMWPFGWRCPMFLKLVSNYSVESNTQELSKTWDLQTWPPHANQSKWGGAWFTKTAVTEHWLYGATWN